MSSEKAAMSQRLSELLAEEAKLQGLYGLPAAFAREEYANLLRERNRIERKLKPIVAKEYREFRKTLD